MPLIGTFTAVKDGYAATIRTLNLNSNVEILANDHGENDVALDLWILAGATEIGAAWRKTKHGSEETFFASCSTIPACRNLSGAFWSWPPRVARRV